MYKKILILIFLFISLFFSFHANAITISELNSDIDLTDDNQSLGWVKPTWIQEAPWILWTWLPWWKVEWEKVVLKSSFQDTPLWKAAIDFVITFIKYIAIIAVISLMFWWIMYILSWWEEEKVKKAKSWIIWSIVWVFMSVSAWWIIKFITQLSI